MTLLFAPTILHTYLDALIYDTANQLPVLINPANYGHDAVNFVGLEQVKRAIIELVLDTTPSWSVTVQSSMLLGEAAVTEQIWNLLRGRNAA